MSEVKHHMTYDLSQTSSVRKECGMPCLESGNQLKTELSGFSSSVAACDVAHRWDWAFELLQIARQGLRLKTQEPGDAKSLSYQDVTNTLFDRCEFTRCNNFHPP